MNLVTIDLDRFIDNYVPLSENEEHCLRQAIEASKQPEAQELGEIEKEFCRIECVEKNNDERKRCKNKRNNACQVILVLRQAYTAGRQSRQGPDCMDCPDFPSIAELEAKHKAEMLAFAELLECLVDENDCWFDHHGGCQEHGYLTLQPGDICPQQQAKNKIADIRARVEVDK